MLGAEIATACLFGRVAIFFCGLLLTLIRLWGWNKRRMENGEWKILKMGVFSCLVWRK